MLHTPHPFPGNEHIVRDFSEDRLEINTPAFGSAKEVAESLNGYYEEVQKRLIELPDRAYLSGRYGRYKMTFSGIHVNYSFNEELLRRDFALSGESDFDYEPLNK